MTEPTDAPSDVQMQVLVDQRQGALHLSLARVLVPPGGRTFCVLHQQREEVWCVIRGRALFYRQAELMQTPETAQLLPGDAVFVPPGHRCWVENTGPEDFVLFCCGSPPWQDSLEPTLWNIETAGRSMGDTDPLPTQTQEKSQEKSQERAQGEYIMPDRFEYKILVSDSDDETDEETLNGLGDQGWELVNAVADVRANEDSGEDSEGDDQNVPVTVFYFKRRKEQA